MRKSTTGTFGITTRFMQHKRFGLKKCLSRLCKKRWSKILNLFTFIDSICLSPSTTALLPYVHYRVCLFGLVGCSCFWPPTSSIASASFPFFLTAPSRVGSPRIWFDANAFLSTLRTHPLSLSLSFDISWIFSLMLSFNQVCTFGSLSLSHSLLRKNISQP